VSVVKLSETPHGGAQAQIYHPIVTNRKQNT